MRVDQKLNLIIKVDRDEGGPIYVHSTPVSREVFETYYLPISKAFAAIYGHGLSAMSGPRVAAMVLKDVSIKLGVWEGPGGVQSGLVEEIRRLTTVVFPGPTGGWQTLPLYVALQQDILSADDLSEVESLVTFFIVNSLMHKKAVARSIFSTMNDLWGTSNSLSSATEFAGSLTISTEVVDTSPPAASSVPS